MLRLASARVERPAAQKQEPPGHEPQDPRAAEFVAWLRSRDLRPPDRVDGTAHGTRPDLIYHLPDSNAAVFVTGPDEDGSSRVGRDEQAHEALRDLGWTVIVAGPATGWASLAGRYPSVFGASERK